MRILSIALIAALLGFARPALAFDTEATHVFIMDYDTGATLFDKAGEEHIPTASMSKMMTAYVVFQQLKAGKIKLTDTLPVSEKAWREGGAKSGGSTMFLPLHGTATVDDLIKGMLIQSGNDACIVLAEGIAGSEDAFVRLMNDEAPKLGLKNSHFADVTGLPDPDHYMTAHDLALLGAALIRDFPEYYHYFSDLDFTYNNIKQGNRNPLLYDNIGADGIKTGHTEEAGYSLTASVKRDGKHLIIVATGMKKMKDRRQETERIVDFAFRSFDDYAIATQGEEFDQAEVLLGDKTKVPVLAGAALTVTMPRESRKDMKVTIDYNSPLKAPVAAGTQIGTLTMTAPGVDPRTIPLVTGASVAALGRMARMEKALDYMIWHGKS